jgi:hypothetical protein
MFLISFFQFAEGCRQSPEVLRFSERILQLKDKVFGLCNLDFRPQLVGWAQPTILLILTS